MNKQQIKNAILNLNPLSQNAKILMAKAAPVMVQGFQVSQKLWHKYFVSKPADYFSTVTATQNSVFYGMSFTTKLYEAEDKKYYLIIKVK